MDEIRIDRAENDVIFDDAGRRYIDLFTAHGTTWLGHANPAITLALKAQLDRVWITGTLATAAADRAKAAVERLFPPSHGLVGLCSTGMEAAEFAIRIARRFTGRMGLIGFSRSMHGKSLATSHLAWDNGDGLDLPDFHRLPFPTHAEEPVVLDRLGEALGRKRIAGVFIEPIQGSGGGYCASEGFYRRVASLCADSAALVVFDELLTGLYRTGPRFFFENCGVVPDLVLIGKGLGNGFPVSGVVANRRIALTAAMLPGSTFSGNPLAASVVAATIEEIERLDMPGRVADISRAVDSSLGSLDEFGFRLRGRGAFWTMEIPTRFDADAIVREIYGAGVAVGRTGHLLRFLPPVTIGPSNLAMACEALREVLTWAAS
jgi:acetylornithine/succinyldiaminopimelate/putrescine aminotransferase